MFKLTSNKGFHMTFANNLTISVQFGGGNYCDHFKNLDLIVNTTVENLESKTAEVAVWDYNNDIWITKEVIKNVLNIDIDEDIHGYLTTDEIAKIITYVSELRGK